MMSFKELVRSIEQLNGVLAFSEIAKAGQDAHGDTIPFEKRPTQQFLTAVNAFKKSDKTSRTIVLDECDGFNSQRDGHLTFSIARIMYLESTPHIYVNTDIFPKGLYQRALAQNMRIEEPKAGWKQLATAVCHSQRIDCLVKYQKTANGEIVANLRTSTERIKRTDPSLLLLSTSVLDFALDKDNASRLSTEDILHYIKGMYQNLFSVALSEKYTYIAMPAVGLGIHKGDPKHYFSALMEVTKLYPTLNIIYNPAEYGREFNEALIAAGVTNVVTTTKDAFLVANALTEQGYPCAFHNAVDCSVIYHGNDDRQMSNRDNHIDDAYLNIMTSAPLNHSAFGLNAQNQIQAEVMEWDLWIVAESIRHPGAKVYRSRNAQETTVRDWLKSMRHDQIDILSQYYSLLRVNATYASQYIREDEGRLKSAYIELILEQLDDELLKAIIPIETERLNAVNDYLETQVNMLRAKYQLNLDAAKQACRTGTLSTQWKDFIVLNCVVPKVEPKTSHLLTKRRVAYQTLLQTKPPVLEDLFEFTQQALSTEPEVSINHYVGQKINNNDDALLPTQQTYLQIKQLLTAIHNACQTLDKDHNKKLKETPKNRAVLEGLAAALDHATGILMIPTAQNIPAEWSKDKYNANLDGLVQLAQHLSGHGSAELQVVGGILFSLGVAAVIAFVLLPAVPAFASVFTTALSQAGFYNAAATIGGQLGAAAGAGIVGALAGVVTAAGGATLFGLNRQQGVSKIAAELAQTERLKDSKDNNKKM